MKKILFSGIQPTNKLTIGNYLGAIKKIIDLQEQHNTFLFVADLHARTLPINMLNFTFDDLEKCKFEVVKMYCACGIDIKNTKVFYQSSISEHLELFYFLLTHSSLGELKRMSQYKFLVSKLKQPNQTNAELIGVLIYPVLMSADILLYDADFVAVGQDQKQHLELTREIASRINIRYKKNLFKIPDSSTENNDGLKIMDLQSPDKKMSKTCDSPLGVIFLSDTEEDIRMKIMKSKTDSFNKVNLDKENQPGIFNLLTIYANINNLSIEQTFEQFKDSNYGQLKESVSSSVVDLISKIQQRYASIDDTEIQKYLKIHTENCQQIAAHKMKTIYQEI